MKTLSASQITRFDHTLGGCARRWGYEYLDDLRPAPHPSAALGTAVHAQLEAWLKSATAPTSAIALAGIPHAPPPGIAEVERAIELETANSKWRGFIDALYGVESHLDILFAAGFKYTKPFEGEATVIHDWKTSADPKRYGKSADDLATDAQANLYAAWAFREGAQRVQGRWVYLATKGLAVACPRHVIFERARVEDVVGKLDETARVVQKLYQIRAKGDLKSEELPANRDACRSFGGCPHAAYCPPAEMSELFGGSEVNQFAAFLNDIDSKVGAPAPAAVQASAPPTPFVPPTIPAPPPARPAYWQPGDPMNSTQEYLAGVKAPLSVIANAADVPPPGEVAQTYDRPAAPVQPPPVVVDAPAPIPAPVGDRPPVERGFVNPPEAPAVPVACPEEQTIMPMPVTAQPAPVVSLPAPAGAGDIEHMDRDALKNLAIQLGVSTSSDRSGAETLRGKILQARAMRGEAHLPLPAAAAAPAPVAPEPAPAPVAPEPAPAPVAPEPITPVSPNAPPLPPLTVETLGFRLFVNCMPVGAEYTLFSDVLRTVMPKVRELSGVPDYRMVDYGKGAGLLANTVRTHLLGCAYNDVTNIVVDSRTPEGRDCIGVLEELASEVCRGF